MRQAGELSDHPAVLADYLDHWAQAAPDRIWLSQRSTDGGWNNITFADAKNMCCAIGAALLDIGLGPDRPLLILSGNGMDHGLLGMAACYVGVPYAPVSTAYSLLSNDHSKLKAIATLLNPGAIFADDGATYAAAFDAVGDRGAVVINSTSPLDGAILFSDMQQAAPAPAITARQSVTPDSVAKYLFTSGSTGTPKAVINSNRMICAGQAMMRDFYPFLTQAPPVVLDWAPWNHTAGGNNVFYLALTNGGTYYIDDGRPVPGQFDATLRNLRDISCSYYFNVPIGYDMLVDALEQDTALAQTFFAKLDLMFYAGAAMSQHTWDRLYAISRKTTGRDVLLVTGLGATETSPFALAWTQVQDRPGNVGVPSKGMALKLVPTAGKLEARVKGPNIMPGYYKDPAKTNAAFDEDGYYRFGDALRPVNPEDYAAGFYFDGRLAENFKLTTGTWVPVGAVRASIVDQMNGLIRDAVIVGENRDHIGALLWLSETAIALADDDCRNQLRECLTHAAAQAMGSATRITRAIIMAEPPSFDGGEITEKGSLNQRALRENRTALTEAMFAGDAAAIII